MKMIRAGILAYLAPKILAFLQRKLNPAKGPAAASPSSRIGGVRPNGTKAAVMKGSLAGLASGYTAVKATRGARRIHPLLTLVGYIVGGIAAAVIYEKFAPSPESMRTADARVVE